MTKNRINVKEMEIKMWLTQRFFRLARLLAIIGQITSFYWPDILAIIIQFLKKVCSLSKPASGSVGRPFIADMIAQSVSLRETNRMLLCYFNPSYTRIFLIRCYVLTFFLPLFKPRGSNTLI